VCVDMVGSRYGTYSTQYTVDMVLDTVHCTTTNVMNTGHTCGQTKGFVTYEEYHTKGSRVKICCTPLDWLERVAGLDE